MISNLLGKFEEIVSQNKEKLALEYKTEAITFEQLQSNAMRCAKLISTEQEKPIAVFVNRGIYTGVFFLATLYSGNYYVPIDPDMPIEKMRMLFEDADFYAALGEEQNRVIVEALQFQGNYYTVSDFPEASYSAIAQNNSNPAYMIYTSGSTGKPKGVLKSHESILSFVNAYIDTFGFTKDEVIGNQTPFFFDAAAKDFYLMLLTGATIEIIPTELFSMTTQLVEFMNDKKITFASWVPTALTLMAQMCPFSLVKPQTLRRVFFVGEVMPMKHLNKWRSYLPDIEYVNLYGQTELAGICCYYRVEGEFEDTETLPMGSSLNNCKIYLIDGDLVVKEKNHIGEVVIHSDALAMEYYKDSQKTREAFVYQDYGDGLVRCFKTGDLAYYREDGNLVFASRADYQIKHMGHRIELGEIEAVAGSIQEIDRCCCLYDDKKKAIVLFCQLTQGTTLEGTEIRSRLKQLLTSYMLPKKIKILECLPLNANGKIDRQALKKLL